MCSRVYYGRAILDSGAMNIYIHVLRTYGRRDNLLQYDAINYSINSIRLDAFRLPGFNHNAQHNTKPHDTTPSGRRHFIRDKCVYGRCELPMLMIEQSNYVAHSWNTHSYDGYCFAILLISFGHRIEASMSNCRTGTSKFIFLFIWRAFPNHWLNTQAHIPAHSNESRYILCWMWTPNGKTIEWWKPIIALTWVRCGRWTRLHIHVHRTQPTHRILCYLFFYRFLSSHARSAVQHFFLCELYPLYLPMSVCVFVHDREEWAMNRK